MEHYEYYEYAEKCILYTFNKFLDDKGLIDEKNRDKLSCIDCKSYENNDLKLFFVYENVSNILSLQEIKYISSYTFIFQFGIHKNNKEIVICYDYKSNELEIFYDYNEKEIFCKKIFSTEGSDIFSDKIYFNSVLNELKSKYQIGIEFDEILKILSLFQFAYDNKINVDFNFSYFTDIFFNRYGLEISYTDLIDLSTELLTEYINLKNNLK